MHICDPPTDVTLNNLVNLPLPFAWCGAYIDVNLNYLLGAQLYKK